MKTGLTAIAFCLTFCCMPQPSVAQTVPDTLYGIIKTRNPFALSRQKRERLQRKAEKRCQRYLDKYGNPDLSTWDRADRMDYLHHKAVKVILILAPDYYRNYAYRSLRKEWPPKAGDNKKRAYCYELTYYYDARQEECADNNRLATVRIWKENGQPCTLSAGPFEIGNVFFPAPLGKTNGRRCTERKRETLSLCHFSLGRQYFILKDATNPRTPWPLSNDFLIFCRYEK